MVVGLAEKKVGLIVNSLIGQEEIVIKSLGEYLASTEGIAGATIMGDGHVTLIIDIVSLMNIVSSLSKDLKLTGKRRNLFVEQKAISASNEEDLKDSAYKPNSTRDYILLVDDSKADLRIEKEIIEEAKMKQDIVVDANAMLSAINSQGRVALYGIYFDFNKSEIKPESKSTLKEISELLSKNQKLNLYVVGHTDNVGDFNYNMKLSQSRAEAVVNTLVSEYSVNKNRLKAAGVGPLSPVTTNNTEEGKAKNRRVELIKK